MDEPWAYIPLEKPLPTWLLALPRCKLAGLL
jgi:hypothetical protein